MNESNPVKKRVVLFDIGTRVVYTYRISVERTVMTFDGVPHIDDVVAKLLSKCDGEQRIFFTDDPLGRLAMQPAYHVSQSVGLDMSPTPIGQKEHLWLMDKTPKDWYPGMAQCRSVPIPSGATIIRQDDKPGDVIPIDVTPTYEDESDGRRKKKEVE